MSYTFENILYDTKGISYKTSNGKLTFYRTVDGHRHTIQTYNDDKFSTIGRAVVQQVFEMHPELSAFRRGPMVPVASGIGPIDVLAKFNYDEFKVVLAKHEEFFDDDRYNNDIATINDYASFLKTDKLDVQHYKLVNAISNVFTNLRLEDCKRFADCGQGNKMDYVPWTTFLETGEGSVKRPEHVPVAKFRLLVTNLGGEGDLSDDEFVVHGAYDVFTIIGSTITDTAPPTFDTIFEKAKTTQRAAIPVTPKAERKKTVSAPQMPVGFETSANHIDQAVDHVLNYCDCDVNQLTYDDRVIAFYGSEENERNYDKFVSKAGRARLSSTLKPGSYDGTFIIKHYAQQLYNLSNRRLNGETAAMLAAGRIISWKGNYQIDPAGPWIKIR